MGNIEDNNEWFIMLVNVGKMYGKVFLRIVIGILLYLGVLLDWKDMIIFLILFLDIVWKWNFFDLGIFWLEIIGKVIVERLWVKVRDVDVLVVLDFIVEKNLLNLLVMILIFFEYIVCVDFFWGI